MKTLLIAVATSALTLAQVKLGEKGDRQARRRGDSHGHGEKSDRRLHFDHDLEAHGE